MATIHCKACGATYHYEKEGCCPSCGAYNRPPKRERVNADGTVQHMTDAAYEKRQHARDKVCFEEKECYEEKVCYEDQARQGNTRRTVPQGNTAPKPTGPVPHSKFPQTQSTPVQRTPAKQNSGSPVGCLVTFIMVAILLGFVAMVGTTVLSSIGGW